MPCALAGPVSNSPIFQPARIPTIFRKSIASPNIHGPQSPTSSTMLVSSPPSLGSSPTSPLSYPVEKTRLESNSGTLLKRKRPARIHIPVTSASGFGLETSRGDEQKVEVVEVEDDGYSVYCKRGRRGPLEDRYSASVDVEGNSKLALFGVFDGHGGPKAAEYASRNLDKNIMAHVSSVEGKEIEMAIKNGYLTTDREFLEQSVGGGACCITALIHKGNLAVSSSGDCRAVMSRGGVAEALTSDHRPSREDERRRIEALGGYVDFCNGVWRVQGTLAVTRGIGDVHLKQWVTAEPETKLLELKPECEFLILATDGLWDKVSNQEAVDIVRPLCIGVDKPDLLSACKKLSELSLRRGSIDDISVMIIQLGQFALEANCKMRSTV
ncbi:hypothetical protein K2173_002934 [Erythroxylum novogranatense]|uniref:protein-serine/threonine phosphatase n=1 Tax=Erythroxylum novogranatense TaxID=1862640 RepID=A0AAV8TTP6_9ROSI|nr:hypothetical protein K2173_002934 [Erythroxylum novogranatense]